VAERLVALPPVKQGSAEHVELTPAVCFLILPLAAPFGLRNSGCLPALRCSAAAHLIDLMPHPKQLNAELRIFECADCGKQTELIVTGLDGVPRTYLKITERAGSVINVE
jgi:hypothetical protein